MVMLVAIMVLTMVATIQMGYLGPTTYIASTNIVVDVVAYGIDKGSRVLH